MLILACHFGVEIHGDSTSYRDSGREGSDAIFRSHPKDPPCIAAKEIKGFCCGSSCTPEKMAQAEAAKTAPGIKILGSGCAKCNALEEATRTALVELGMEPSIDHITDFAQIAAYGVMTTPALVVDGKVVS